MNIDTFHGLVRNLSNQCWVRYYLHLVPGKIVLEVADPRNESLESLDKELTRRGFVQQPKLDFNGWTLHRWTIARTDQPE